ncbi:MAG: hypothetical protein GXY44_06155 [Phycisphaerales bacterium]|nr:hypothetical protein [Phycisphaerales bacterium]
MSRISGRIPGLWTATCLMVILSVVASANAVDKPLGLTGPAAELPAPWIAGRRATARVRLEPLGLENVVTAPADAFRRIWLRPEGELEKYEVFPNYVVRNLREPDGRSSRLTFFAAAEWPWIVLLIDRGAKPSDHAGDEKPLAIEVECEPNLDYINQFAGADHQHYQWTDKGFMIVNSDHPDLNDVLLTDARIEVEGPNADQLTPGKTIKARLYFTGQQGMVVWGAGEDDLFWKVLPETNRAALETEFKNIMAAPQTALGAQVQTPDEGLNRYMRLTRLWLYKSVRMLPVGEPYKADATDNQEIAVPVDAPNQPRISTAGSIQFMREALLFAPDLETVYQNALRVLDMHAKNREQVIPASITFGGGARKLAYDQALLGHHPQWVIAASDLVLLSGNREIGEQLWPTVERVIESIVRTDQPATFARSRAICQSGARSAENNAMAERTAWTNRASARVAELAEYLGKQEAAARWRREAVAGGQALDLRSGSQPTQMNSCCAARPRVWDVHGVDLWYWRDRVAIDRAVQELLRRAGEELALGLPAACIWPVQADMPTGCLTPVLRALRTVSVGLFGLEAVADGLLIDPYLPRTWPSMTLSQVPFRGRTLTITVKYGEHPVAKLNDDLWEGPLVLERELQPGDNRLDIVLTREP